MGGHVQAQTPNINRLISKGIQFTNAHANAPICGPSRASLWTGMYPSKTGYYGHNQQQNRWRNFPMMTTAVTVMEHYSNNGYKVYGSGKVFHNGHEDNSVFNQPLDGGPSSFGPFPWDGYTMQVLGRNTRRRLSNYLCAIMVKIGDIELSDFPLLLAPMEDVSDPPFRALCKEQGADVVYTEFISSEGLIRDAAKSVMKLDIYEAERPVGIQIFGANLDSMLQSVDIVEKTNPDIIDINFGCPVKKVVSKGAGAGILKDIPLMVSLTAEMVKRTNLPVTVKTRLGWDHDSIQIVEVAERLQDVGAKAISIHGRTRAQMYKGEADWTQITAVKNNSRMHIPVFGNGDVNSPERAIEMRDQYGLDGAMIGRASIGNPWFFNEVKHFFKHGTHAAPPSLAERATMARRHLQMAIDWKGEKLGVFETRRHYTNYFKGIPDFKPYRQRLVTEDHSADVFAVLNEIEEFFGAIAL
jgi:nifR3 family TIM-barrel protein